MILLSAFLASAGRVPAADPVWAVVSRRPLDLRIEAQVRQIAADNQTEVTFGRSRYLASRHRPALVIDFDFAEDARSFGRTLARITKSRTVPQTAHEGYVLNLAYRDESRLSELRIIAASADGFHNALLRLPDLLRLEPANLDGGLFPPPKSVRRKLQRNASALIADFPSFNLRGVVEGFYGTPWSHQDRLDILRFEGEHGLNTYYYGPKNDPYHRQQWREPYPKEDLERLSELVQAARANFVDFCFAVSPGLSISYSDREDFAALTAKFDSVAKLGASCFALFLDDVPQKLQDPRDRAQFSSLAKAHVELINRLYRRLKSLSPRYALAVVPTTYTNSMGNRDYIRELGVRVDRRVNLMWTGPEIVSPEINAADAREWGRLLRRPPLVWDNFPVNDGIPWRLVLGPVRGRDSTLNEATRGLLSNPMNQAHASMIPLSTVAEYLWNPQAYRPDDAQRRAVAREYGKDAPDLLAPLLQAYCDYWWQDSLFKPLWTETRLPIDLGAIDRTLASMESSLNTVKGQPRFTKLVPEIDPVVAATRQRTDAVAADPAFRHLENNRLAWNEDYDLLTARRLDSPPALDADFAKWQDGPLYGLDQPGQVASGATSWKGPEQFSARFALGWDDRYLYVGIDVSDPDVCRVPAGVDIRGQSLVILDVETAFHRNYYASAAGSDAFPLLASPGNFQGMGPSLLISRDSVPARFAHYAQEVKAVWKKTERGYSGDIVLPASYFDAAFHEGYELGLVIRLQKALGPPSALTTPSEVEPIRFSSKQDRLFPVSFNNPATYQRLVLVAGAHP